MRTLIFATVLLIATSTFADIVWDPASSTYDGTPFVELQAGVGAPAMGLPSAANPVGTVVKLGDVYAFGFSNAIPGSNGPTLDQTELGDSPLTAGTDLVLRFRRAADDHVSFLALVADASDLSTTGVRLLSETEIEVRARIANPVVSESNNPDGLDAAFGLVAFTTPTLTESFNMRTSVFVTDMHWLDVEPPDFSELPQGADDIQGFAAGLAAKGIGVANGGGPANFTAFMPEAFFEFARENGVEVTGADCLGYRAFVELTGSDEGFFKLNDPADRAYVDDNFDVDGDGDPDEIWRYRITNATWSRQVLAFGKAQSTPTERSADFNGDSEVDFEDFLLFASAFGKSEGAAGFDARFDLNGSGKVDFEDFLLFAADFGK